MVGLFGRTGFCAKSIQPLERLSQPISILVQVFIRAVYRALNSATLHCNSGQIWNTNESFYINIFYVIFTMHLLVIFTICKIPIDNPQIFVTLALELLWTGYRALNFRTYFGDILILNKNHWYTIN